jgi:DNA-binding LytR/AlgR family response regulator
MITCFIVDDEPIARRGLREYITREGDIKILAECENIIELRMRLQEMSPDIIFLDIEMPYASGMDWLSTANTSSLVILTTAYEQYALRSYDFNVVDYLLKPIPYARFSKAIVKARKLLQKDLETEGVDYIVVKVTQTKRHKILFRDITYIEAQQNYCNIHHRDDTQLMVRTTLNNILEQLPSDMFCQVHRSFIVNKTRITSMDTSRINIGGISIPVSRTYKEKLL